MNALTVLPSPTSALAVIDRTQLARALGVASKLIEARNQEPFLANVALFADERRLIVRATDLEQEIEIAIDAIIIDPRFAMAVNAKKLNEVIRRAPASESVSLTAPITPDTLPEDEKANVTLLATVRAGGVEAIVPGHWFATHPQIDEVKEKPHCFAMSGSTFWSALDDVRGAVSTDESRYYLNGVFMHRPPANDDGDTLVFVATDGHRLVRRHVAAPDGTDDVPGVILSSKVVDILHTIMKGRACPPRVDISVSAARVEIGFGSVIVTTKPVDGTFPDYQRVIPTGADKLARIKSQAMAEALRSILAICETDGRAVRLVFEDGTCRMSITNPDRSKASIDVPCEYKGDPVEIGFDASYMLDAIGTACPAGEHFHMALGEAGSPAVFRGEHRGFTGVLMPMRV